MSGHNNFFSTSDVRKDAYDKQQNTSTVKTTWYPSADYPIGLTMVDFNWQTNIRAKTYFDGVTYNASNQNYNGTIHLDTWGDSVMNGASCTWLDVVKHDRDIQHGKVTVRSGQLIQKVSFPTEFASQPAVVVWIAGVDIGNTGDWRIRLDATDISQKGFQVTGSAWGSTKLNFMDVSWIAYPASRPNIDSGIFDTMNVRNWEKPQFANSQSFDFKKKFERVPRVYFALTKIDSFHSSAHKYNLRLKGYITDTTTKGLKAHLDSWCDNNMYSARGEWIAIQDY